MRRYIPDPEILARNIKDLYDTFATLKNAKGDELINATERKKIAPLIKHARSGCFSDPPGAKLYLELGKVAV